MTTPCDDVPSDFVLSLLVFILFSVPCFGRCEKCFDWNFSGEGIVEVVGWGESVGWNETREEFWLEFLTMVIDEDSVGETVGGVFLMHVGWKKDISKGFGWNS